MYLATISIVMHPPVKEALCSLNIWDVAENGLATTATDEAACDFVELLDTLLRDPITCYRMAKLLSDASHLAEDQIAVTPR